MTPDIHTKYVTKYLFDQFGIKLEGLDNHSRLMRPSVLLESIKQGSVLR